MEYPSDTYMQKFSVPFEYPVHFTHGLFAPGNTLLADTIDRLDERRRHRVVVYVDSGTAGAFPELIPQIKEYFHAHPQRLELAGVPAVLPGSEQAKTAWPLVRDVIWNIGNLHLDRQSFVLAIGGGGLLDMVGFAAAIVHRGLRLLRVPTTTLAQNDAGVGVKNGMDEHGQKNFIGAFAPPFAVLNDFDFITRLPQREWIAGAAEAFKVAIIKDAGFFDFLCRSAATLKNRDQAAMEETVRRCAVLHLKHIAENGDPFEFGSARPLDFGHWAAHRIELMTNYQAGHGQAVSVGVAMDSFYAMRHGLISAGELERIIAGLQNCGLPIYMDCLQNRVSDGTLAILEGLNQFREHLGGSLTITLPSGLGKKTEVHQMNVETIEEAIAWLKDRSGQKPQP